MASIAINGGVAIEQKNCVHLVRYGQAQEYKQVNYQEKQGNNGKRTVKDQRRKRIL